MEKKHIKMCEKKKGKNVQKKNFNFHPGESNWLTRWLWECDRYFEGKCDYTSLNHQKLEEMETKLST